MIEIENLSLVYPLSRGKSTAALSGVNARFGEGTFSVIIGPSGCGKTSLIRIMAGLLRPEGGTITAGGSALEGVRKNTAVIFQDFGLLPWKTVRANAELPLHIAGKSGQNPRKPANCLPVSAWGPLRKIIPGNFQGA